MEFRFVVDENGRPIPSSITLLSTTDSTFNAAARLTVMVEYFRPGLVGGRPVRVLVRQPITYGSGRSERRCELNQVTPLLPPRCW